MGNFNEAYLLTGHNEGGYANNPSDHGGETYAGISRKFWPAWQGWVIIDAIKKQYGTTENTINLWAKKSDNLQLLIASFYKQNFWDVNKLDLITDNQIADNVYDFGVNSGVSKAAKTLQLVSGVTQDGIIGNATISAVNSLDAKNTYERYNAERIVFYHNLAANPGQLQFLKSWLSRIKPYVL